MSKGYLTTHVLDTYNGKPGSGIKGSLFKIDGENKVKILNFTLNEDGRCDEPILGKENFIIGKYGNFNLFLENMSYYFFAGVILRNLQIFMNHSFLMT